MRSLAGTMRRRAPLAWLLPVLLLLPAPLAEAEATTGTGRPAALEPAVLARFEASLEELRRQLRIPGLSAAIVSQGRLAWARGFGHADVERGIEATADTPYHLASVTKPFAAVVTLQLVEEGLLSLDDPVCDHGLSYESRGIIRVRHLLSHTSSGQPGTEFRYDSDRYADLGWLLARVSGRSFRELLVERIVTPLGMESTAPTPLSMGEGFLSPFRIWLDPRNARVYGRLARPYAVDGSFAIVDGHYPIIFTPASGLVSSVADLVRFDVALDEGRLVPEAARARMFAPAVTPGGRELPYGLGWFTQVHGGTRLVWHYGWNPPTSSALFLKLPDEGLTFIALANTDALSRPFDLGSAETLVLESAVALAFYEAFALEALPGRSLPRIDWEAGEESLVERLQGNAEAEAMEWRERELLSYRRLFHATGRADLARRLDVVHDRVYPRSTLVGDAGLPPLGEHLLPWPSAPLFGMGHVTALACCLPVFLSMLVLWPLQAVRGVLHRRHRPPGLRSAERVTAALAALLVLGAVVLYIVYLSRFPAAGPLAWSDGSLLVRSLIAVALASGVLAVVLALQTVRLWWGRRGSRVQRVYHALIASAVLAGAWAVLDLTGWLS